VRPRTLTPLLLVGLLLGRSAASGPEGQGERRPPTAGTAEDRAGDAEFYPGPVASPDLRSATVALSPTALLLRVQFAPGTYAAASTFIQFSLVLGQEASQPASAQACCGNYVVDIGVASAAPGKAQVKRLKSDGKYELIRAIATTSTPDVVTVSVPVSLLPSEIRRIQYRVVTCLRLDGDAVSPILDALPDDGLAAGAIHSR
jgi:hypothetical protein